MGSCPHLPSWPTVMGNKGLEWGLVDEVQTLQSRIRTLLKRDIDLVSVIQVMLVR